MSPFADKDRIIPAVRSQTEKPFSVEFRRNDTHTDGGPDVDVIAHYRKGGKKIQRFLPRGPALNGLYNAGFENKILQVLDDAE